MPPTLICETASSNAGMASPAPSLNAYGASVSRVDSIFLAWYPLVYPTHSTTTVCPGWGVAPVPSRRSANLAPDGDWTKGLSPGARDELLLLHSVHSVSARAGSAATRGARSAAATGASATARREGSDAGSSRRPDSSPDSCASRLARRPAETTIVGARTAAARRRGGARIALVPETRDAVNAAAFMSSLSFRIHRRGVARRGCDDADLDTRSG